MARRSPLRAAAAVSGPIAVLMSDPVAAQECSTSCGTPSDLGFCSYISFGVCGSNYEWDELDNIAATAFTNWTNATTTKLGQLPQYADLTSDQLQETIDVLDLANTSSACGAFLKKLECAVHFPVCEIGRDYKHVCANSCREKAKKNCPGLVNICTTYSSSEVETKSNCFKLDYSGPSVGMWVAGFLISLIFSVLNSVGINLQKLSMSKNEMAEVKKGTFSQPLWVMGFGLVCLGSLLDFVAFGMAPQTLLAPLAALSLVWNMFIAPIFHKEKVTKSNIVATVIIFLGVTITVIFAGHSTPSYELEDLIRLYGEPVMHVYIFLIVCFIAGLLFGTRYIERTHNYEGGLYHIVCYGGVAGTFGGQSVLLAKSTVELLKSAIWGQAGGYMFTQFTSYVIIAGLGVCLACQVHFLNGGLARFDALVVIPVYQSFWILTSVLGGIMYFEEYVSMTKLQMAMFSLGGIITIGGIIFLLKTRRVGGDGEEDGDYVELSVTPNSAWVTEDSDEEEVPLKLSTSQSTDKEETSSTTGGVGARVAPNPRASTTSTTSRGSSAAAVSPGKSNSSDISSAIYRSKPSSPAKKDKRSDDDDGFF